MADYWYFARYMLAERSRLVLALIFALLSAGGLGVGMATMAPVLQVILAPTSKAAETTAQAPGTASTPAQATAPNTPPSAPAPTAAAAPAPASATPSATIRNLPMIVSDFNAKIGGIIPASWISALPEGRYAALVGVTIFLAVLTIVGAVCNFLHSYYALTIINRTIARIREECFRRVVDSPLATMVAVGPSTQIRRIVGDSTAVGNGFNSLLGKLVAQLSKGIAAIIAAFLTDWRLATAAVLVAPVLYHIIRRTGKIIRRGTRASLSSSSELLRTAYDACIHLRVVKTSTAETQEFDRFKVASDHLLAQDLKVRTAKAISSPLTETLAIFVLGFLMLIAGKAIIDDQLDPSSFLVTLAALGVAGASLRPLTGFLAEMQSSAAAANQLREVLNTAQETAEDAGKPALPRHRVDVEFQAVSFTYPAAEVPAVRDVSLKIPHGSRIAFVGPNGCGKTTLLSLLPRLFEPDPARGDSPAGRILIDGTDIATVTRRSIREQIGVVTQDVVLFKGSITTNIRYAAPGASDVQVRDAARKARAEEFIAAKPGAYDAPIGEGGSGLSGGQKQRIAIARAILRDPAILILDEATSMIDADSEAKINDALDEFSKGRTCLVVAHRLSTVLRADLIVVMNAGRIEATGTHAQLLATSPTYQLIARTQLLGEATDLPRPAAPPATPPATPPPPAPPQPPEQPSTGQ
jgi:subfamily B ATP-binding cassette protein MsbA